jgi:heme O synthase-like polyprenyltransferase
VVLLTTLPLVPLAMSATALGLVGMVSAVVTALCGIGFTWFAWGFFRVRDDRSARRLFLASITYLPVVLAVMTIDRGPGSLAALFKGRGGVTVEETRQHREDAKP